MSTTTTTKREVTERVARKTGVHRDEVRKVVQAFLDELIEELAHGHRLEFRDFGVFDVRTRASRVAQNPKTLVQVAVPSRRVVRFKAGRLMRDRVETPPAAVGRR
ncbi:MAG: integration host factor subunit beta [Phycisphaeraceae bacterium]|nr:integration host factor subunit beta [Phycisphaeraceae bacterium]